MDPFQNIEHIKSIITKILPKLLKCEAEKGIFRGFRKAIHFHQKLLKDLLESIERNRPLPPVEDVKETVQDAASLIATVLLMKAQERKKNSLKMYVRIVEKESTPIFTLSLDGIIIYANPAAIRLITHIQKKNFSSTGLESAVEQTKKNIIGTNYDQLLNLIFDNELPNVVDRLNDEEEVSPGTVKACVYKLERYYDIIGIKNSFLLPRGLQVDFLQSRWIDISSVEKAIRKMMTRFGSKTDSEIDRLVEVLLNHEKRALLALADLEELRDIEVTGPHIMTVYECCKLFADILKSYLDVHPEISDQVGYQLPEAFTSENFAIAATLHDIGKVTTPDEILRKPGKFTSEEWEIMKLHTVAGAYIISDLKHDEKKTPLYKMAENIARSHHEKWAGKSYPDGLAKTAIPIEARITSVFDVFDALLTDRFYKKGWSMQDVKGLFQADFDREDDDPLKEFDPIILKVFLSHFEEFVTLKAKVEEKYHKKVQNIDKSSWLDQTTQFIIKERKKRLQSNNIQIRST